jgi:phytoene dehydrogenase-like protein
MQDADYIIVGSGINALVCAALLGRKGRKVLMLERNDRIGGCIRTEEVTAPGFVHDVMATTFVLFVTSPAFAALGPDLEKRGAIFVNTDLPTGVVTPDGLQMTFSTNRVRNIGELEAVEEGDGVALSREMDRLGADAPFLFALLGGSLWSSETLRLMLREGWRRRPRGLAAWFGEALVSGRGYLESRFQSELVRALFAPWVLHVGLGPESAYGGQMLKVIAFALEAAGAPIVKGGARNLLQAFEELIKDQGGAIQTSADVDRIERDGHGRARGVRLSDGSTMTAKKGVICSVGPGQLYKRLLGGDSLPADVAAGLSTFRYGKGNFQLHYALSEPPRWKAGDLNGVALLHLSAGLDSVSRATNECERSLLPVVPTLCVGQPVSVDPQRAPEGRAILWVQIPEAPRVIKGDAAGEIRAPEGKWSEDVRERFADRVEGILQQHIDGFRGAVLGRRAYSPADLEAMNVNLVGGDPYGGFCGLDQSFVWRPFKTSVNSSTHVPGLYHIGASTHPGPGLGGGSGYLLAQTLK